jgi:hypothetical protein
VLSGSASRHTSVTDSFDRESFNSVEQTFTVVVVSFMVAPTDVTDNTDSILICVIRVIRGRWIEKLDLRTTSFAFQGL